MKINTDFMIRDKCYSIEHLMLAHQHFDVGLQCQKAYSSGIVKGRGKGGSAIVHALCKKKYKNLQVDPRDLWMAPQ